jgi:hypothetical protein
MADPTAVAKTYLAVRAKADLLAAKSAGERDAVVDRVRMVDSDLADELAAKAAALPGPLQEPTE